MVGIFPIACNSPQALNAYPPTVTKLLALDQILPGDILSSSSSKEVRLIRKVVDTCWVLNNGKIEKVPANTLTFKKRQHWFRSIGLGFPVSKVLQNESDKPVYQDELGVSYVYALPADAFFRIDYYILPDTISSDTAHLDNQKIVNIQVEIEAQGETQALQFYRELLLYLKNNLGEPKGTEGQFSWIQASAGYTVYLSLSGKKQHVFLSISPNPVNPI
jgi:hypothetical protein